MFGFNTRQLHIVEFECSPAAEGKLTVVCGLLLALLCIVSSSTNGFFTASGIIIISVITAVISAWGIYLWKFRRRPLKREVTLGTWSNRLYLRNRLLYFAATMACNAVIFLFVVFVCTLVFDGFGALADEFTGRLSKWFGLLIILLIITSKNYLGYYQYYHSRTYLETLKSD